MIADPTKSCARLHATASVTGDIPASRAIAAKRRVDSSVRSLTKRLRIACVRGLCVA